MNILFESHVMYKRDSTGKVREWHCEAAEDNGTGYWRTVAGLQDGKKVTSEWRISEAKNVGRANATTSTEQACLEAEAEVKKKKDEGYFTDIKRIDSFDKFKPMLAQDYAKLKKPLEFPVATQPKLDGIRCIARADGLWTRAGKPIVAVPHIWEQLEPFFEKRPNIILDGELYNHELKDDFNTIVSCVRKTKPTEKDLAQSRELVQYHVYDCFEEDFDENQFSSRNSFLVRHSGLQHERYPDIFPLGAHVADNQEELDAWYADYISKGYEGQMVRILDSKYELKRSKFLLKRKEFITEEYKVIGMEEGLGNWSGCVKRFNFEGFDGGTRGTQKELAKLWESGNCPDWATVRYFELTPDGVPRFPVVIDYGYGERED